MNGIKEQIRTGTGHVIGCLNFSVPELMWCELCEEVVMTVMSHFIQVTSIFGNISLGGATQA
jgi:hypothetical protein